MYNYVSTIRKSSSITNCIKCFFINEDIPNLLLTKNNTIEIYDLTKEGLKLNKSFNIYGYIKLLLSFPVYNEEIEAYKDNIFILTESLDYCVLSFDQIGNKILTLFSDSINLDIGTRQDNILYSLDIDKNFLLISAYKNVFKLICLNYKKRLKENYNDFIIKYQYESILFLSNYTINNISNNLNENVLTFAMIKIDTIKEDNSDDNNKIMNQKHEMSLETFQIKVEPKSFNIYYYEKKQELNSNNKNIALKVTSNRGAGYKNNNISNTHEKLIENFNFLQKIDISENPTVNMMITHPEGIIFLFFSNYALYYKYDITKKKLIEKNDKKVTYTDRKFNNYAIIDEKNYKYFISDEFGNLFIMALISHYNSDELNEQFVLQILGEINYSTCMVYLDNNYLFNGSNKANSQLIKIENNTNSLINVVQNYESLSPIKDFILINNMEEENAIEFLTISGLDKNCAIKKIKKGSPVIFKGGMNIKNLKDVFKIDINNKENIYTLIITTISKTFVIDYNYNTNEVFINNKLKLDNNELIIFIKNLEKIIIIVSNLSIKIYNKNLDLILNKSLEEENKNIKITPLIVKYNKKISTLFIYTNKQNLIAFKFDINGNIIESTEILKDVSICDYDICKYFLVYALWDSNNLFIYSLNSKKIEIINIPDECLDYTKISSIQIFKYELFRYIFISLSTGKLIYFQLRKSDNNYDKLYTFSSADFIFKRKYNLNVEDFTIKKIKQKNNNSLFINTQTPLFIHFNKENLVISYFNIKSCKNLIEIIDDQFLFILKDKINFGTFINIQSQNIISKYYGKQINQFKLISFKEANNNEKKNKTIDYILTVEENKIGNRFKNCLVLNDINMKEISRFDLPYENEQSNSINEIKFKTNINAIDSKLFIVGTSIIENISKEPIKGHLYLLDIKQNNNYKFTKLLELETNGGIHKVISCQNFVYAAIGNILYIYKIKQLYDNSYEIKQIKKYTDFTLINDIELLNESKNNYENNQSNNNNINITITDQYLIVSDIGRSIGIYCFSLDDYKFTELYRDNSNTWIYSSIQISDDTFYIADIEGNIISLKKNVLTKGENDPLKLQRIAYYNFGERINSMILTKIKNKDLYSISNENIDYDFDDKVNIIFFVSLEGSLGQIIQINKDVYLFLEALQKFLVEKNESIGGFKYNNWKMFNYGMIKKQAKGFIEGDLIEKFLNNDDIYKKQILKDLNYNNWNKTYEEIIHILEILVNNH